MASEIAISQPRIDQRFVDDVGRLTQYGYSLLTQVVGRLGGPVGEILDARSLSLAVSELQQEAAALPVFIPQTAGSEDPSAEVSALRAEVAALRVIVEGLQQGYHQ